MGSPRSQSPGLTIGQDTWTMFRIALFPWMERTKPVFRVLKLLIIELYWSLVDFLLIPNQCYPQTFPSRKISYNNIGSSHATWRTIWSFQWQCSELLPSHWRKSAWAGKDDPHSWAEQVTEWTPLELQCIECRPGRVCVNPDHRFASVENFAGAH